MPTGDVFSSLAADNRQAAAATRSMRRRAGGALVATTLAIVAAACADSNVPFLTAPTKVDNSPTGIQNAVSGLFSASRFDLSAYVYVMTAFARDNAQFTESNPEALTMPTGLSPMSFAGVWDQEYANVGAALAIIAALPRVSPVYPTPKLAAGIGVIQTMEAVNLMLVAETRDTLGIPVQTAPDGGPGPVYCNKDVWKSIVALLDSANTELTMAGPTSLPFNLPPGFGSVSTLAGPSTTPGSFAAFNRALAAKAGLELAYAIARNTAGTHPTPTSAGAPDVMALTRADSAAAASALFDTTALAPPAPGGFTDDSHGVYWDFSGQSGDVINPVNAIIGVLATLKTLAADVDTLHDLRWRGKFAVSPYPLQLPQYDSIASVYDYAYYPAPNTPIPIIRTEGLVLIRAQLQLGLGHFPPALALLNAVRTHAGGLPPVTGADYITVRDQLLKEQRISTVFEGSGDRTIALRMYHLEAVADTTWGPQDLHTTVLPVVQSEMAARKQVYSPICP
jgi:starch-binding outer membrane protein, SusD/RagB family